MFSTQSHADKPASNEPVLVGELNKVETLNNVACLNNSLLPSLGRALGTYAV